MAKSSKCFLLQTVHTCSVHLRAMPGMFKTTVFLCGRQVNVCYFHIQLIICAKSVRFTKIKAAIPRLQDNSEVEDI